MAGNRSGAILPGRGTGSGASARATPRLVPTVRNPGTADRPEVDKELSGVRVVRPAHPEVIVAPSRGTVATGPEPAAGARTIAVHSAPIAVSVATGGARTGRDRRESAETGPADPMIAVVPVPMIRAVGNTARIRAADVTNRGVSGPAAPGRVERSPTGDIGSEAITDLRTVPAPTMPAAIGAGATSADAADRGPIPMIAGSDPVAGQTALTAEPAEVTRRARRRTLPAPAGRAIRAAGAVRALPGEPIGGHRVRTSRTCPRTSRPVIWIRPSGATC